jgi:thiamine biosynthesis lipoprotein
MRKSLTIVLLGLLILTGCTSKPEYQRYQADTSTSGFDTKITLMAYTTSESEFTKYFDRMKELYYEYNILFDKYNNYEGINNLKTINDMAGKEAVEVDQRIIDTLVLSREEFDNNKGKFDITMGSVLSIWHDYREDGLIANYSNEPGEVPPLEMLQESKECTGWDLVEIDDEKNTVYLTKDCASLDLGGLAKGYATQEIMDILAEEGLTHFSINAGGNVKVYDLKPDGSGWNIAVGEPSLIVIDQYADILRINEELSIVASGDYQRYYIGPNDETYHHLIDPDSLFPLHHFRKVTVVMEDSTYADMYSTVLFLLPYEEGVLWIKEHNERNPHLHLEAHWVIDIDNEEYKDHPDFMSIPEKPYKIAMTDGLREMSHVVTP